MKNKTTFRRQIQDQLDFTLTKRLECQLDYSIRILENKRLIRTRDQLYDQLYDQLGMPLIHKLISFNSYRMKHKLQDSINYQLDFIIPNQLDNQPDYVIRILETKPLTTIRDQLYDQLFTQLRIPLTHSPTMVPISKYSTLNHTLHRLEMSSSNIQEQLNDKLYNQLWNEFRTPLENQIWDQLHFYLNKQLYDEPI